jgi:large subunit ribosomal protein L29
MKVEELRSKEVAELNDNLNDLLKEHFSLRMQHKGAELKDTSKLSKVKKQIARVKTIIREKS